MLARDTVRFVGEPVAVVVAETAAAAADAAEHVVVDIEPRPAVVALPDAATGNTLVHQHAGTNVAFDMPVMVHTTDNGPSSEPGAGMNVAFDMPVMVHTTDNGPSSEPGAGMNVAFDMPVMVHTTDNGPSSEPGAGMNVAFDMPVMVHTTDNGPSSEPGAGMNVAFDMPVMVHTTDNGPSSEPGAGMNVAFDMPASGHVEAPLDFSGCDVTVEASLVNQRLAAVPLEPRSAAAEWFGDGTRLTFYASTQAPHRVRDALAALYGMDEAAVRVVTPDVGGGFGAKGAPSPEELVLAGLARAVGRPVAWTESRAENLTSSVHGRAQSQRLRLGGTSAGRITHYELDIVQDAGAYPMIGAFLPTYTRKVFTGCYRIANASISGRSYVTNTAPVAAYRGAGRPEAIFAIERAVDLYAAKIGLDPAEVRRLNFVAPEHFPYTNSAGSTYDSGDFGAALDRALAAARYGELRAEQADRRASAATRYCSASASPPTWRAPRWVPASWARSSWPPTGRW